MESQVNEWLGKIDDAIDTRLEASGIQLYNAYRDQIRDAGLIDTGRWIGSVDYVKGEDEVRAGTPVEGYPYFLEVGFRHHVSGELIGPYRPLTKAAAASEGPLRLIWGQPIR